MIARDPLNPPDGATLVPLAPGLTVADALAGLPDLPADHWVCLDAEPLLRRHPETGEDEWATRRVAPGQVLWILPRPPLGDQGGSQILAAIAIAAPCAAAATPPGQLAAAGLTLGADMIIAAFVPQMQAPTDTEPAGPSPSATMRGTSTRSTCCCA